MVLGTYFLLTLGYSLWAKRIMILDIILLAVLYTLRIIAGGAAASIPTSFWLLSFSVFFFLALAMVKRYSELLVMKRLGQISAHGRGYHTEDFPVILSLGTASGYAAVLVLALYINSPEVRPLYHHPEFLWILIPVLLFWMSRIWLITHRGGMHDDPVIFAIKDKISLLLLPLIGLILLGATK
jgi:4-hydroxybenzoate polyprenyltransferase